MIYMNLTIDDGLVQTSRAHDRSCRADHVGVAMLDPAIALEIMDDEADPFITSPKYQLYQSRHQSLLSYVEKESDRENVAVLLGSLRLTAAYQYRLGNEHPMREMVLPLVEVATLILGAFILDRCDTDKLENLVKAVHESWTECIEAIYPDYFSGGDGTKIH